MPIQQLQGTRADSIIVFDDSTTLDKMMFPYRGVEMTRDREIIGYIETADSLSHNPADNSFAVTVSDIAVGAPTNLKTLLAYNQRNLSRLKPTGDLTEAHHHDEEPSYALSPTLLTFLKYYRLSEPGVSPQVIRHTFDVENEEKAR